MLGRCLTGVAIRVLEPVQVVLEGAIVFCQQALDQRVLSATPTLQPAARIGLRQRPAHDRQALLQHGPVGQHQHRHGAFGRGG